jgi:hypothetical protein
MVDFLEKGLIHHVAEELGCQKDSADTATRLERAFLMADIHSQQAGVQSSGATVALCLVKVSTVPYRTVPYRTVPYRTVHMCKTDNIVTAKCDSLQAEDDKERSNCGPLVCLPFGTNSLA